MTDNPRPAVAPAPGALPAPPALVVEPGVYPAIGETARSHMPRETIGLLLGTIRGSGAARRIEIRDAVPLEMPVFGFGTHGAEVPWADLKAEVPGAGGAGRAVVGWFYADPGIGIFRSRLDLGVVHRALAGETNVFLLINPSTDEGGFYRWTGAGFVAAGEIEETRRTGSAPGAHPWTGTVEGADTWLAQEPAAAAGAASLVVSSSTHRSGGARPRAGRPAAWARVANWPVALVSAAVLVIGLLAALLGAGLLGARPGAAPSAAPAAPTRALTPSPAGRLGAAPTPSGAARAAAGGAPTAPTPARAAPATLAAGTPDTGLSPSPTLPAPPPAPVLPPTSGATAAPPTATAPADPPGTPTPPDVPAPPAPPAFGLGDRAKVGGTGLAFLAVHSDPDLAARTLSTIRAGQVVRIAAGPRLAGGITWWQVTGWNAQGTPGWVSGFFLTPLTP